jgi:type IV pilus assembly protein PilE
MKTSRGFSLIELLVVVAVIAIIVGIGYPSYLSYTQKARRADGIAALNHAAMVMESCRSDLATYEGCEAKVAAQSEKGYYTLAPSDITASSYKLTATAVNVQAKDSKCTKLTLTAQGTKGYTGTAPDVSTCWGS